MDENELDELEKIRDEIEDAIIKSKRRNGVDNGSLNPSIYNYRDLGIEGVTHVYNGYDHGATSEDIQKALDRIDYKPSSNRYKEALDFITKTKITIAKTRLWLMKHKILPKSEYFNVPYWMSDLIPEYLDFINPGGKVVVHEGTFSITSQLVPKESTTLAGFSEATQLEVQSDIPCINIEGTDENNLKEHLVIEQVKIEPANGVSSTEPGVRLKYVGDLRIQQLIVNRHRYGIYGPVGNVITQCKFNRIHLYQCGYGISVNSTFDNRWRSIMINSPTTAFGSGGKGFVIVGGAGGDEINGVMVLQGSGFGLYFDNCEWLMIHNCIADDCIGGGWEFIDSSGSIAFKGLQLNNCWAGSSGLNVIGGGVYSNANAKGFYFNHIKDPCELSNLQTRTNANSGILFDTCENIVLSNIIAVSNSKLNDDKHGIEVHDSKYISIIGGVSTDTSTIKTQTYGLFEGESTVGLTDYNNYISLYLEGNEVAAGNTIGSSTRVYMCHGLADS